MSSSSDKTASSIEDSKSSTSVSSVSERSSSHSSGTYVSQPRNELESLLKEADLLSTSVDEQHTGNKQESSIEESCTEFVYEVQSACDSFMKYNDYESLLSIVPSEFHTTTNGISEIHTLKVARLKDQGNVFLDLERGTAYSTAHVFVAFYNQWEWWNKNYHKFHKDSLPSG
jgi:hypothetical protein